MKKIFFVLIPFLFLSARGFDYSSYCASKSPSKTFFGNVMSLSGANFVSRNIIESKIEDELKKETNSKFKVDIDSFFGTSILNGEFKSLKVSAKNYSYKDLFASNFNAQTICSYNKVSYDDKKLVINENVVLTYSTEITQQDLDKTVASSSYQKLLDRMSEDSFISSLFKIQNAGVKIREGRLVFKYEVLPFPKYSIKGFTKPVDIVFGANLKVEDNKIQLCDFDLNSIKTSYSSILPLINLLNPLNYEVKVDKNTKGKLEVEEIKISEGKIKVNGYIFIPKGS